MGQLPKERVKPSLPFYNIGVDLCGPFSIKASPLKFDRTIKVLVLAFVCLITKAVHLELTTSLSADNFLAALSRFTSRRGTPQLTWSDRGTNFIGHKHNKHVSILDHQIESFNSITFCFVHSNEQYFFCE